MTATQRITVSVVEDEPRMRERVGRAIMADPSLHLHHSYATARDALAGMRGAAVDVMLVDLGLPDVSGLEVIRACRRLHPQCEVLVLTIFGDENSMLRAFEAGAKGYLLKDGTEADLAMHVRSLQAGGSPMSPVIARQLLHHLHPVKPVQPLVNFDPEPPTEANLTGREQEILERVARGFTYTEIATQLDVSATTVRTHVRNIYSKLDVHTKTEAIYEARQLGLLR